MAIGDVEINQGVLTIQALNADLSVTNSSSPAVANLCGSYALINQIISDLVTIKNSMKSNEKLIRAAIAESMAVAGSSGNHNAIQFVSATAADAMPLATANGCATASNLTGYTETGTTIASRGQTAIDTNNPAVLTGGSINYTENAVTAVLTDIFLITANLRHGGFAANTVASKCGGQMD